jgi:RNA polymerase sigma factor (sigma-70 family)
MHDLLTNSLATSGGSNTPNTWLSQAFHCLSLTLHHDYLSNGKGHQQTRQVMSERSHARCIEILPSATSKTQLKTAQDAAHLDDLERRYLTDVASKKRLTSSEEYCLARQMQSADEAQINRAANELVEANLGLVVMFAQRYKRPGIPLMDIVAEGNFGLMKAARRFNPELGNRFSTYAKWWVRQAIQQAMPKLSGVVRTPLSQHSKDNVARTKGSAVRSATPLEQPSISSEYTVQLLQAQQSPYIDSASLPNELIELVVENAIVGWDDKGFTHKQVFYTDDAEFDEVAIEPSEEPPSLLMQAQLFKTLQAVLTQLSERELTIVSERYALVNDSPSTLAELSQKFGVSIERIRQIEAAAMKKLLKSLQLAGVDANSMIDVLR